MNNITTPEGHYEGQIRREGTRQWRRATGKCISASSALSRAMGRMERDDVIARAVLIPDNPYLPQQQVMEARK